MCSGNYQAKEYGEDYHGDDDDERIEIEPEWTTSIPRLREYESGPQEYTTPGPQKIEFEARKYKTPTPRPRKIKTKPKIVR